MPVRRIGPEDGLCVHAQVECGSAVRQGSASPARSRLRNSGQTCARGTESVIACLVISPGVPQPPSPQRDRQHDREAGTSTGPLVDLDGATMSQNDGLTNGQPEPMP